MWCWVLVQPTCPVADGVGVTNFLLEYNISRTILPHQERMKLEVLDSLIVLEGLDGAGTTTQASLLTTRLAEAGHTVHATSEPTRGPIGRLIRDVLAGRVQTTPESLAMLYAADRHNHVHAAEDGIIAAAGRGFVVCDRYVFSSLAYQTVQCDYSLVFELNRRFPLPGRLVYLDVTPELTEDRRRSRSESEIFENLDFQRAVYEHYRRALEDFAGAGMRIHVVDGHGSPEHISDEIWKQLAIAPIN